LIEDWGFIEGVRRLQGDRRYKTKRQIKRPRRQRTKTRDQEIKRKIQGSADRQIGNREHRKNLSSAINELPRSRATELLTS
jgi:hypothetical protein